MFRPFIQLRSRIAHTAIVALLISCGGSDGGGGNEPLDPVLTTLEVSPTSAAIYNTAPGNTVALTATGKDQTGATMAGTPTFASSNTGVATVSPSGTVTAVAAGTAQITASLQIGNVTKATPVTVTVEVPPAVQNVSSTGIPQARYVPAAVHLSAGGEVIWTFGPVQHSVTFVSIGSPTDIPQLVNGSDSRTFPNAGTFNYVCDFHPTMSGTVYVH